MQITVRRTEPDDSILRLLRDCGLAVADLDSQADRVFFVAERAGNPIIARGYRRIERENAPPTLKASTQFSALCPASSSCLMRSLQR